MKLRNVALLAALGVIASTAGAMAIPVPRASAGAETPIQTEQWWQSTSESISRFTAGQTLAVDARLGHSSLASGSSGETYLYASIAGADAPNASAPPVNLAIVVDRSGSMKGERIASAIAGAVGAVERMRDGDSVTVVSFDTEAQVVVPPTSLTSSNRPGVEAAIRSIRLGGDTCISCGLQEAMAQLSRVSLSGDHVNRILLLSDGATNHGIVDLAGLRGMAGRMRDKGCSISTIGVDVDFDEKVMAAIANESNGRHHFVANASGLPAVFAQEFDNLVASVARDAELSIELPPGVEVEQVFDRTFRREGNRVVVPFGTFSAKQEKTVLLKLRVPVGREGVQPVADMKLTFRDLLQRSDSSAAGSLALVVKGDGTAQKELDPFVAARLERSRTAQTLTEANILFEQGRGDEARRKLALQAQSLKKAEAEASALARRAPVAKPKAAKSLDKDFGDQIAALDEADRGFAQPPPNAPKGGGFGAGLGGSSTGGPFATAATPPAQAASAVAPTSREGKTATRQNQANAAQLGF
jgi:Ca-activated chloride channel family protein